MTLVSVIITVYNLDIYIDRTIRSVLDQSYPNIELILVDDRSPDNSWAVMEKLSDQDFRVKSIRLSRNVGQHRAITAGLDHVTGNWIVVMDCDLQDVPEEVPRLYSEAIKGFDCVTARRVIRKDKFFKKLFSALFYSFLAYMTDTPQDSTVANFGMYHRRVINSLCSMREEVRYFPLMIRWLGYNYTSIQVTHSHRTIGQSSYSLRKLIKLALEIIVAFSTKPLRLAVKSGAILASLSFCAGLLLIFCSLSGEFKVQGWASLIVTLCFFSGIQIFVLGILGLYIGKTFDQVKNRPLYFIDKTSNITV